MAPGLTSEYSVLLGFSFNKRLGKNFELWRNAVMNQDIDCMGLIDGSEGSGKSMMGGQAGVFFDHERQVVLAKQVGWDYGFVSNAIRTLPRGTAIIYDESARTTDRRNFASKENMNFNRLLRECRQYGQFLILILPSFYDMDMVSAVWRTRWLLHIWYDWNLADRERPLKRGFFRFYNEEGKKQLYTNKLWRQQYRYPYIPNHSFDGTFPNHWVFDHEEYKRRKKEAEEEYDKVKDITKPRCSACDSPNTRYKPTKKGVECRNCGVVTPHRPGGGITHIVPEAKV